MVSYLFFLSNSDGYWFVSSKKYYSDSNWKYEQFAVNNENWKNWIVDFSFFKTMEHVKKENLFEKKKHEISAKYQKHFRPNLVFVKKTSHFIKDFFNWCILCDKIQLIGFFQLLSNNNTSKKSLKLQYHTSFMDISKLLNIQMNIIGLMETTWLIRCKI